ncbi:hypothetical protein K488DRAFT_86793 [Vararia minispora EC-137]|uniref:Uncharacterized protein n=1 Tax=Vararia minispora EC-137 TaxID=1314806 RepID=A0ACB8QIE2_9AGAM|nr:hypothetical protein K488DRAFT_86793 [Vararia minispora EC-137]
MYTLLERDIEESQIVQRTDDLPATSLNFSPSSRSSASLHPPSHRLRTLNDLRSSSSSAPSPSWGRRMIPRHDSVGARSRRAPFAGVEDPVRSGLQAPALSKAEGEEPMSHAFYDFLHLCAQPFESRLGTEVDELLSMHAASPSGRLLHGWVLIRHLLVQAFVRTACLRSTVVHLLATCKAIESKVLNSESNK